MKKVVNAALSIVIQKPELASIQNGFPLSEVVLQSQKKSIDEHTCFSKNLQNTPNRCRLRLSGHTASGS
jgi:hypothetical protein